MSNLKKLFQASLPIISTYLISYLIIFVSAIVYYLLGNSSVDYFISKIPYLLLMTYLIFIIYFLKISPPKIRLKNLLFPYFSLGFSFSIFFNMLFFKISPPTVPTINIPFFLNLVTSGVIGPIYEELLFRHNFYNKLTQFNSKTKSLFINTIFFSLIHLSPLKVIYTFFLGFLLMKVYQKEENILSPILIHTSANITSLFLHEYNTYLFIISFINLFLEIYIVFKKLN